MPHLPWPARRGWRGSHTSGKNKKKQKIKMKPFIFGTWNVRTLLDNAQANRPERRTALVGRELARYKVDIAALSETRLAEEGQLKETGAGYTFFWSGRAKDDRREAGVGFAVRNELVNKLNSLPQGINDRIMTLKLTLTGKKQATIISAYAPTMTNPDDIKDQFYEELNSLVTAVPKTEKLIILGDFNARVGVDHLSWENVLGKNGIGRCNSNGLLLLQLCAEHELLVTNTVFRLPARNRTSWMHPRSKHWHLIDYVIVRKRDRQDVRVTKAMCGAECWTDHRLIVSKLNLRIHPKRRPQGFKASKRLNVGKLKLPFSSQSFAKTLEERLKTTVLDDHNMEAAWSTLREAVYNTAFESLGPSIRVHKDWFDENCTEIMQLLEDKRLAYKNHLDDPSSTAKKDTLRNARSIVQQKLREMQDSWLKAKADEIQRCADFHDMKNFYSGLKEVYGPTSSGSSPPLLSAYGSTFITEKEKILERWASTAF